MPKSSIKRCSWVNLNNQLYVDYHDNEWGVPIHDDQKLFEMLVLEGAQAGLSWELILNKRKNYQKAFDNFDPKLVAKYDDSKQQQLLKNNGIVRNKLKIKSAINNAKIFLDIQEKYGSFDKYIWGFVDHKPIINQFTNINRYPTTTDISDRISKDLKKRGMSFVGSTIVYSFMQAVGMVNDHLLDCDFGKKSLSS